MRDNLSLRLDSIEVEKQMRKRKSEVTTDLDQRSRELYDSLFMLREQIKTILKSGNKPLVKKEFAKPKRSFFHTLIPPQTTIDWIIAIVALIAFLSGTLLLLGLFNNLVLPNFKILFSTYNKSRFNKRTQAFPVNTEEPLVSPTSEPINSLDNSNSDINKLRLRMSSDLDFLQRLNGDKSPFTQLAKKTKPNPLKEKKAAINEKILNAAKKGLSVQDISRKFHISADQVALILRIDRKKKIKN